MVPLKNTGQIPFNIGKDVKVPLSPDQLRRKMAIQIQQNICNTVVCNSQCLMACMRVHGDNPPLTIQSDLAFPVIDYNRCTSCFACGRACPLDAIVIGDRGLVSTKRITTEFDRTENSTLSKRPYEVADSYSSMSEADTIFARVQLDTEFEYYHQTEFSGAQKMISKQIPGYGRFEHELSVAAWKLYDSRHSIKRPGIGLDPNAEEIGKRIDSNSEELTEMVKRAALFLGADMVGIAELDRNWLYTHNRQGEPYDIPLTFARVIVMPIEMDYDAIATSPSFTSAAATGLGYSMMAFVEAELVSFIHRMGYNAITCGNDIGLSVPMAIDAGLGQYGRHGLLITKPYGPRVRIAKVLTDMPLLTDSPDEDFCKAVIKFCETCEKCAHTCPSQAIPYGKEQTWEGKTKSNNPGIKKWFVDVERCYGFWIENGSECSNCVRSCPYNKRDGFLHRTIMWVVQHMPWLNPLVVKMDDLVGYGKQRDGRGFWRKFNYEI
ncbi:MAG: reductive dehalogenase [Candidatus Thorarchaeota archaeon]|nr:reductive dehalogenase [Candidatus Thorarchaeota archaeon]